MSVHLQRTYFLYLGTDEKQASVSVGEIHIEVQNLTAKINLDAQVLQLLSFNAGVDLSIQRVNLLIQNVTAKVLLEARLANLVLMIVRLTKFLPACSRLIKTE